MDESKCASHGLSRVNSCNWCAKPICKQCMEYSGGKKYCTHCFSKLKKGSVASLLHKTWGEKPKDSIINIDPALDASEIKRRKQIIAIKERARKIYGEKL
jgi:hypothetical protein